MEQTQKKQARSKRKKKSATGKTTPREQPLNQKEAPTVFVEDSPDSYKKIKGQVTVWKEKYTRLYADFENFRKRNAKERIVFLRTANEELIVSLLPVLDDLERARLSIQKTDKTTAKGFALIEEKFSQILTQRGLSVMETKKGDAMDIECQAVISQMETPDMALKGKVLEVAERGYRLEDKIIRFAKVIIGK